MESEQTYFLVTYRDPQNVEKPQNVTLKARQVTDSNLGLSFVRLSEFIFADQGIIVSPSEENLRQRFEKTKSLHLSLYSIISIEEVGPDHSGLKFTQDKSNLLVLDPQKQ